MIPDEALEAGVVESLQQLGLYGKKMPEGLMDARRDSIRKILEAAAPHLLAKGWDEGYKTAMFDKEYYSHNPNPYRTN